MTKILGFDVSSTAIGWSVIEVDGNDIKFIECNYFKPIKEGSILERLVDTRAKINQILNKIQPDYIAIEDIIKFMKYSTATTVVVLTTYNRMICLAAYDYLDKYPRLYNVMTIRHGLKINKILPKKEDMPELVAKHLRIKFPYQYNKNNKLKSENYDMADGVAVALYCAFDISGKIKKKIKKK